jgi:hypothetical protein
MAIDRQCHYAKANERKFQIEGQGGRVRGSMETVLVTGGAGFIGSHT